MIFLYGAIPKQPHTKDYESLANTCATVIGKED